jgi:hypothetical protein
MIIPLINISYNVDEAISYYKEVKNLFPELHWTYSKVKEQVGSDNKNSIENFNGWLLDSRLLFGFAKKVHNFFPDLYQPMLTSNPPGTKFSMHVDSNDNFKVYIPIISNDNAKWFLSDKELIMNPGTVYLLDSDYPHGSYNGGDCDRTNIWFKYKRTDYEKILNLQGHI